MPIINLNRPTKAKETEWNSKAITFDVAVSLTNTGWSGNPLSKTVTVANILSADLPIIDLNTSTATLETIDQLNEEWSKIYRATTGTGTITFFAKSQPSLSFNLNIKVVR